MLVKNKSPEKRTLKKWKDIIEDWERSSLSGPAYSREKNIYLRSLYYWKKKLTPSSDRISSLKEKWKIIIADWERSGLNGRDYCRGKDLDFPTFTYWQTKFSFFSDGDHIPKEELIFSPKKEDPLKIQTKWKNIIKDWELSGLSIKDYCREKNINKHDFYYWKRKFIPFLKRKDSLEIQKKWKNIVEDWERSGLNGYAYCRERNINNNNFYYWKGQFSSSSKRKSLIEIEKKWKALITEWERSGLNIKEYCRKNNLSNSNFIYWKKKFIFSPKKEEPLETHKKWKAIIAEWERSGLSARAYCKNKGLTSSTFYIWRDMLTCSSDKKEKWVAIINDQRTSSLTQKDYCIAKGLNIAIFSKWKKRLILL